MNALAQHPSHRRPTVKVSYCHDDLICGPRFHVSLELMTETGEETRFSKYKNHCFCRVRGPYKHRENAVLKKSPNATIIMNSQRGYSRWSLSKNQTHYMRLKGGLGVFFSTGGITEIDAVKSESRVDCHQESVAAPGPPGRGQRAEH